MKNMIRLKRITSVVTAGLIAVSILVPTYGYSVYPKDIIGHWAEQDLIESKNKGVIGGYPDGTMKPNSNVTKAEAIKIINKSFGITGNTNTNNLKYTDVKSDAWYAVDVAMAIDNGYITKVATGTKLYPNSPATREELATMIIEAMGKKSESNGVLDKFKDKDSIGKNHITSMATAVNMGLFGGYEDNTIRPQATVTRAIMAAVTNRASGNINPNGIHTIEVGSNDILIENNGSYHGYRDADIIWVSPKLGNGSAELFSVKAKSKMVVQGGGTNTITLSGETKIPTIYLEKENAGVALDIGNKAIVGTILANAGDYGLIIGDTEKLVINTPGIKIDLEDSKIKLVEINAPNVEINLNRNTRIEKLVINKEGNGTKITGSGRIEKVIVNANDCKIDVTVSDIEVGNGITGTTNKGEDVLAPDMPSISSGNVDVVVDSSRGSVTVTVRVKNPGTNKANIEIVGSSKEYNASNLNINKDGAATYTFTNVVPGTYKAKVSVAKSKVETENFRVDTMDNALANAKESGKREIQVEFNKYVKSEYSSVNWTKLEKAKADGDKAVDSGKTVTAVNQARDNALNAMAKVATKLDEDAGPLGTAKRSAIAELESVYKNYNKDLYNEKQLELLLQAKNDGIEEIYNASTTTEINLVKNDTLKAMANVKTTLEFLKAEAKEVIKVAYEAYDKSKYSNKGLKSLADIVSEANQKIEASPNSIEVEKFKAEALKSLEDVADAPKEIENAKANLEKVYQLAIVKLDESKIKYEASKLAYSITNRENIEKLFEDSAKNILSIYEAGKIKTVEADILKAIQDIEASITKTISDFEKILTVAQEALNTEKADAKKQIQDYRASIEDDYSSSDITKLNNIITNANLEIDKVALSSPTSKQGVVTEPELVKIITDSKTSMDKVRLDALTSIKVTLTTNVGSAKLDIKKAFDSYKFETYSNNYAKLQGIYDKAIQTIDGFIEQSSYITVDTKGAIGNIKTMISNVVTINADSKKEMATVNTNEQEQKELLLNAKKDFNSKLQAQFDSYLVDRPEHGVNWQKMEEIKSIASTQIVNASLVAEVESIFNKASEDLKVLELEKPGLKLSKESSIADLIKNFGSDNYFEEDQAKVKTVLDGFIARIQLQTTTKITEVNSIVNEAKFELPKISQNKEALRKISMDKLKAEYIRVYRTKNTQNPTFDATNPYLASTTSVGIWPVLHDVYYYRGIVPIGSCDTRLELANLEIRSLTEMKEVENGTYNPVVNPPASQEALNRAKTTAQSEFTKTAASYASSSYSATNWTSINQIKSNTEKAISSASTIEALNVAKTNGTNQLKAIKTRTQEAAELSNAKTAAKRELTTAYSRYVKSNYTTANWTSLTRAKTNGDTAINNAKTVADVNKAKQTALNAMANIKRK